MNPLLRLFYRPWCRIRARQLRRRLGAVGRPVRIREPAYIFPPEKLKVGSNVGIYEHAYFEAMGGITIGDNVSIGRRCTILSMNHTFDGEHWDKLPWSDRDVYREVTIGDNVWLGVNVTVLPGVTIGEGAVVGAGSVVTRDVPACAIVSGNPAEVVRYRDQERYETLKASAAFNPIPLDSDRETLITS